MLFLFSLSFFPFKKLHTIIMKNLLFLLLLWFSSSGLMAQNTAYSNQTIFESLSTLSPVIFIFESYMFFTQN